MTPIAFAHSGERGIDAAWGNAMNTLLATVPALIALFFVYELVLLLSCVLGAAPRNTDAALIAAGASWGWALTIVGRQPWFWLSICGIAIVAIMLTSIVSFSGIWTWPRRELRDQNDTPLIAAEAGD
jgi:hypothetical protein